MSNDLKRNPTDNAGVAAKECEQQTGLPAALTMAQWALESGWGKHSPGNNCFGIKLYPGCESRQLLVTGEWFTPAEAVKFVASVEGRTALRDAISQPRKDGRYRYRCQDWFAAFDSLANCFVKHAKLITDGKPYARAWAAFRLLHHDPEQLARDIAPIYATDPDYADKIVSLMNSHRVQIALNPPGGFPVPPLAA